MSSRSSLALVRNQSVDEIGTNGGAFHALWTLQGLGELNATTTEAYRAAVDALKHPAAGVRKAAAMVLPHTAEAGRAIFRRAAARSRSAHSSRCDARGRRHADVVRDRQALYAESQKADNYSDKWLSRAFYIAGNRHQKSFIDRLSGGSRGLPYTALPMSVRLGATKPDWRMPATPGAVERLGRHAGAGNWESRGLPDFDGVVWFTRSFDWNGDGADDAVARAAAQHR